MKTIMVVLTCAIVETVSDHIWGVRWPDGIANLPAKIVWLACGAAISYVNRVP